MERPTFGAGDYAVFGVMLAVSLGIGIFYAIRDRKSKNMQNYLLGGRSMNYWSVGMSLSFSFVSAVTILGVPAEFYMFGSMYMWLIACLFIVCPVVTEISIPLFFRLEINSSYEYLQKRFNYAARLVGTAAYIAQTILYLGVMIYAPSLAFSQVSGFNIWAAIFTTGIVCTIYTTVGGLKAVIWTDVFQGVVVILVMFITMFLSANEAGGWDAIWDANRRSGRIDFLNFDLDPRVRHTVWSITFGLGFLWMSVFATAQSQVQRYFACGTPSNAKKGFLVAVVSAYIAMILCMIVGWVMYGYFENCDPLMTGQARAVDQLLPLMVMRVFRNVPGMAGVFMAAVYAGALSTVSSGINAMACVTVEDFIRPFVRWRESTLTIVSKLLVFGYGITSIGFACLSSILGNVLQTSLSMLGIIGGPLLGLFTLGIVLPFANSIGSISGFFVGLALTSWIFAGSINYRPPPIFWRFKPRAYVSECGQAAVVAATEALNVTMNNNYTTMTTEPWTTTTEALTIVAENFTMAPTTTVPPVVVAPRPAIADLYSVSYAYYTPIGFGATLVVGIIVSLITCGHRRTKDIDPKLIIPIMDHPVIRFLLPQRIRRKMWCGVRHDKPEAYATSMKLRGKENEAMEVDGDVDITSPSAPAENGNTTVNEKV